MPQRTAIHKYLLVLLVFAALFVSDLAVAYDHHDMDCLPLSPCPICASAHVLSFADNSSPALDFIAIPRFTSYLLPFEGYSSFRHVYQFVLNYRAPPSR